MEGRARASADPPGPVARDSGRGVSQMRVAVSMHSPMMVARLPEVRGFRCPNRPFLEAESMKAALTRSLPGGPSAAVLLLAVGLGACQQPGGNEAPSSLVTPLAMEASAPQSADMAVQDVAEEEQDASKSAADDDQTPQERLDEAIEAKVLADQERTYKEAEVEIVRLEGAAEEIEIQEGLREKRAALVAAREELTRFEEREKPLKLREVNLSQEKAQERLLKAETDLFNMRKIMDEEGEAEAKPEIIRRYEKSFEFAQEALAIETEELAIELEAEIPAKVLKLAGAVRAAEAELQAEEIHAERKRRASELAARKAKHDLDQAKRDQKKAKAAVAKARKRLGRGPKGGRTGAGGEKKK